jgi:hypothetical protein
MFRASQEYHGRCRKMQISLFPCPSHPLLSTKQAKNHSPSPKGTDRLPNWRNNSVLPQRRAGLEATGDGGSFGSYRAEHAGCHCWNGSKACELSAEFRLFRTWVGGADVVRRSCGASDVGSSLHIRASLSTRACLTSRGPWECLCKPPLV